jgi:hypothetical protein
VTLAERIRAATGELAATRLLEATLGDLDLRQEPRFARLVEQLVAALAPIVQDVARHSLTSTELVLRRLLSKERREEIFVAKSTLREKFEPLRPELRAIFGRLGLDTVAPPARTSSIPGRRRARSSRARTRRLRCGRRRGRRRSERSDRRRRRPGRQVRRDSPRLTRLGRRVSLHTRRLSRHRTPGCLDRRSLCRHGREHTLLELAKSQLPEALS